MINTSKSKWFLRSLALALLVALLALAAIKAPGVLAQTGNGNEGSLVPNNDTIVGSDAPDGRLGGLAPQPGGSNTDALPGSPGHNDVLEDPNYTSVSSVPPEITMTNLEASLPPAGNTGMVSNIEGAQADQAMRLTAPDQYTSPLQIPAADFRSDGWAPDSTMFWFAFGYMEGDAGSGCVMAPAYVPDGGTLTALWISARDNDATFNVSVTLWRVHYDTGATDILAYVSTTGASGSIQNPGDMTVDNPITSSTYAYYLTQCLYNFNTQFYSARIYYTIP